MARYYTLNGQRYVSVTTVLGVIAKPALVNWAARQVAEAAVSDAPRIARLAEIDPESAVERLVRAPWRAKSRAAAAGTLVHAAAEALAGHGRFEVTPESEPLVRQLVRFLEDCTPEFLGREVTVYSTTHGYAGTADAVVRMHGQTWLLDVKTSRGVYPEYTLQLAAYRYADTCLDATGRCDPLPTIDATGVVHVTAGGWRLVPVDAGLDAFAAFLAALRLYTWLAEAQGTWDEREE